MSELQGKQIQMSHHIFSNSYPMIDHFPRELRRKWYESIDFRFLLILLVTSLTVITVMYRYAQKEAENVILRSRITSQEDYTRLILDDMATKSGQVSEPVLTGEVMSETATNMEVRLPGKVDANTAATSSAQQQTTSANVVATKAVSPNSDVHVNLSAGTKTRSSEASMVMAEKHADFEHLNSIESTDIIRPRINSSVGIEDIKTQRYIEYDHSSNKLIIEEYTPYAVNNSASSLESGADDVAWRDMGKAMSRDSNMEGYSGSARSPDAISRVLLSHNKAIQDFYMQALRTNPSLKGKLSVQFTVAIDGSVKRVDVMKSTLKDQDLERSIVAMIKSWDDFGPGDPSLGDLIYKQTYVFGK